MNDDRLGSQARVSNVGASSAYPPKLSVIADIGTQPGSAMSRREQVQQNVCTELTRSPRRRAQAP